MATDMGPRWGRDLHTSCGFVISSDMGPRYRFVTPLGSGFTYIMRICNFYRYGTTLPICDPAGVGIYIHPADL